MVIECKECGKSFEGRANQSFCSSVCRKRYHRRMEKSLAAELKEEHEPLEATVDNDCPKDCRFMDIFNGNIHYCNYGEIALAEGLTDRPARNADPKNIKDVRECTKYEPRKTKRKKVNNFTIPKRNRARDAENDLIAYKRDCMGVK